MEQSLDYEKFCSQILDADPKIRFTSVYDEWPRARCRSNRARR